MLDRGRVVVAQRSEIGIEAFTRTPTAVGAGTRELAEKLRPATLEQLEAAIGCQLTAERDLEEEGAVVVGRIVEQLDEELPASLGDAVHLARLAGAVAARPPPGCGRRSPRRRASR